MTTYIYWSIFYFVLFAFIVPIVLIIWCKWVMYLVDKVLVD